MLLAHIVGPVVVHLQDTKLPGDLIGIAFIPGTAIIGRTVCIGDGTIAALAGTRRLHGNPDRTARLTAVGHERENQVFESIDPILHVVG